MPTAWGGADPTEFADASAYELGIEYRANADLTISAVRVWTGAGEINRTGREGHVWSTAGVLLGTATMDTDLTPGWTTWNLAAPVEVTSGQRVVVSYATGGNYGALANALTADVPSADTNVTAMATASAIHGNGVFALVPGTFPNSSSGGTFYGVDFVYTLGIGGNTAPVIVSLSATHTGSGVVSSTIVATDAETLVGATYRWDWGDGSAVTSSSSNVATHTYAAAGTYAVLGSVSDAGGLSDYAATYVVVVFVDPAVTPLVATSILEALKTHALASGQFEEVNGHEPTSAPVSGTSASFWFDGLRPLPQGSGLAVTSGVVTFLLRIALRGFSEFQDDAEMRLLTAADRMIALYSGDFELGVSNVRFVDLLGQSGETLAAKAAWLTQDGKTYRVVLVTIPIIVNDIWGQTP